MKDRSTGGTACRRSSRSAHDQIATRSTAAGVVAYAVLAMVSKWRLRYLHGILWGVAANVVISWIVYARAEMFANILASNIGMSFASALVMAGVPPLFHSVFTEWSDHHESSTDVGKSA